jgi:hypothetical protein
MLGEYASKIAAESFKKSFEQVNTNLNLVHAIDAKFLTLFCYQSVQSNQPLDDKVIESLFQKAHNDIINFYDKLPQQFVHHLSFHQEIHFETHSDIFM